MSRIQSLSIATPTPRQTPDNAFGARLSRAVTQGAQLGAGLVGLSGPPVLSAAVSALSSAASTVRSLSLQGAPGATGGLGLSPGGGTGVSNVLGNAGGSLGNAGSTLGAENLQYLELQRQLQRESREFSTVSNVLKARHDAAKAAINNIR